MAVVIVVVCEDVFSNDGPFIMQARNAAHQNLCHCCCRHVSVCNGDTPPKGSEQHRKLCATNDAGEKGRF